MLDSRIQQLKNHFGISTATDWQGVKPEWILAQDGIGQVTLDYIRLCLAIRGLTLKDDRTPEYWQQHLQTAKISHVMGNEDFEDDGDVIDRGIVCPFTIYIDTAEQFPFTFQGFRTDAADGNRPLIVNTEYRALGRAPIGLGDYSLDIGLGRCHVERKSMADAHSTILGWDGRRDRFEKELQNLAEIEAGLVIVECSFLDLVRLAPSYGKRSAQQNAKTLHRSVIAWIQDYKVPWLFCDGRRQAEQACFRWLERYARKQKEERKGIEKQAELEERIERELAAL